VLLCTSYTHSLTIDTQLPVPKRELGELDELDGAIGLRKAASQEKILQRAKRIFGVQYTVHIRWDKKTLEKASDRFKSLFISE
jgi:hypothetical protein